MKIVVVNPERATERRRRMKARLESLGVDYELHRAVDWRDLTLEQEHVKAGRKDGLNFHHGSIAACLSQRAVLADMVERGPAVMAMLEDDIELEPEFPAVLEALESVDAPPFGIVFLHRGPSRRFVPHVGLRTGHELGWRRFSHFGAQGVVITREAARRVLEREPLVRPGFDRTLARYWHHGALTYCLSPPVVRNTEEDGSYVSLIHASPRFTGHGPGRKLRRLWYDAREGARKRLAFARLVIAAHGVVRGGRETLNL